MKEEIEAAFEEMMDISTDIDRAVIYDRSGVVVSNMDEEEQEVAAKQARELVRLAETRAQEMGSQPFTQLAVDTGAGYVFVSRELGDDGLTVMATGKKGSRVGLVLYDLKTCLRDAVGAAMAETPKGKKKRGEE